MADSTYTMYDWFANPASGEAPPPPTGFDDLPGGMILTLKTDEWDITVTDENGWEVDAITYRNIWRGI